MTPNSHLVTPRFESPAQLALIGLCVWLAGVVVHALAMLAWLGLGLMLLAGIAYLLRPRTRTMYWRGRQLELSDPPGPAQRVYRRFFKC